MKVFWIVKANLLFIIEKLLSKLARRRCCGILELHVIKKSLKRGCSDGVKHQAEKAKSVENMQHTEKTDSDINIDESKKNNEIFYVIR